MGNVCDSFCKRCIHAAKLSNGRYICNYLLDAGKPRGCDPGKGCIKKEESSRPRAIPQISPKTPEEIAALRAERITSSNLMSEKTDQILKAVKRKRQKKHK